MKKDGSLSSKSKTRRNSKSSSAKAEKPSSPEYVIPADLAEGLADGLKELGASLAVGHQPSASLNPQDELLFRAFQSNLLSLISHELRTPLMGILNSVGLLDDELSGGEGAGSGIPPVELAKMARQNAQRLQRTLTTLLDMASIESQTFHAHLREMELQRIVRGRMELQKFAFKDHGVMVEIEGPASDDEVVALGDPQKFSRAVDLCLESLAFRAKKGSMIKLRISSAPAPVVSFEFELEAGAEKAWEAAWMHGLVGREGGVSSPASAFAGVMQTEQAFLTRTEEGLGSEFLLIHEIMRLHRGSFEQETKGTKVLLELKLPELSSEEGLRAVLTSRAYVLSNQTSSVALVLVKVPKGWELEKFRLALKKLLYRTTDGAYGLPQRNEIAIVMDDYKRSDLPKLVSRIEGVLQIKLDYSTAHCPEDVADPSLLFEYAKS
ncbi:MAG: sensor histidine kinase [Bdellovibrionia bacterium]